MMKQTRRQNIRPRAQTLAVGPPGARAAAVALAVFATVLASAAGGCKVEDPPPITERWSDTFERKNIGGNYYKTGGGYKIVDGTLLTAGSKNHPLWLRKQLPRDVTVEFDCWSNTPDGDIKIEIFGDGQSYDKDGGRYRATGYVLVMGGWNNSKSILARQDEHGKDMVSRRAPKVAIGQRYRWRIRRQDKRIDWWVDDMETPFLSYEDPRPLAGAGHRYFGFNNWQSDARFDNLVITPLGQAGDYPLSAVDTPGQ
ncbi:MAG: hypothetical protein AAGC55_08665 [Myxococcota bacterium]